MEKKEMKNPYKTLDIDKKATKDEIKKAFKQKARKLHPDVNNGDDKEFKEINAAYQLLNNPEKKALYDSTGFHEEIKFDLDAQAQFCFTQVAMMLLDKIDLINTNWIEKTKHTISLSIKNRNNTIAECERKKDKWNKVIKRVVFKGKGDNLLINQLENKILEVDTNIKTEKERITVEKKALEIAIEYDFKEDEKGYKIAGRDFMEVTNWSKDFNFTFDIGA